MTIVYLFFLAESDCPNWISLNNKKDIYNGIYKGKSRTKVKKTIEVSILRFKIRILRYDTIQKLIDTNLTIRYNSETNKYKSALFVYGEGICTNPDQKISDSKNIE
jgi:hypothetical protein